MFSQGIQNVPKKTARVKSELIDVDLVRGHQLIVTLRLQRKHFCIHYITYNNINLLLHVAKFNMLQNLINLTKLVQNFCATDFAN